MSRNKVDPEVVCRTETHTVQYIRGLSPTQHFLELQNDSVFLFTTFLTLVDALKASNTLRTMNFDRTDIVFVVEKSVSMKTYLPELLESYVTPIIS